MSTIKLSRKMIINALNGEGGYEFIAQATGIDRNVVAEFVQKWAEKANEIKPSKPSAETLKNRKLMFELVDELNARNIEVSAAEFATMVTDSDGYPMSSRKVGALLANEQTVNYLNVASGSKAKVYYQIPDSWRGAVDGIRRFFHCADTRPHKFGHKGH